MISEQAMAQKAMRTCDLGWAIESNLAPHHKNSVQIVTARKISTASALLVDSRFDSYKLHDEKMAWQTSRAIANNTKLERLILLLKNCAIVVQLKERVARSAA